MPNLNTKYDAVIIGGGVFGTSIAIYLAKKRGFNRIIILEREATLFARASYNNQARVHNGYHYPRSFTTAYRSRVNMPKFINEFPEVIRQDFNNIYAIARRNSKVTAKQFIRFCKEIGAKIEPANQSLRQQFESRLIEELFVVEEYVFDAAKLASLALNELNLNGIQVQFETRVTEIRKESNHSLQIVASDKNNVEKHISCKYVFNCTYSGINQLVGDFPGTLTLLKQEITEMALINVPPPLKNLGITVMDGPFFSMMPFPARELHTLSHVRYTPHLFWNDKCGIDPYQKLQDYHCTSRVNHMIKDISRYLPAILDSKYVDSIFEVKTVLIKNESDDGRPILFERHPQLPGCFSILGGKIDNIYDVLETIDRELLDL